MGMDKFKTRLENRHFRYYFFVAVLFAGFSVSLFFNNNGFLMLIGFIIILSEFSGAKIWWDW